MSANLDLVRSIYAARARGDWRSEVEWLHPDIEVVSVGGPDPRELSGLTALADAWREFLGAWESFRVDLQEIRVLDEERVLALYRRTGRGRVSGMEIEDLGGPTGLTCSSSGTGRSSGWPPTGTATALSPTSASRRRAVRRDRLGEPRPRALDLCSEGARRLAERG